MATGLITGALSMPMKAVNVAGILTQSLAKGGGVLLIDAITKGSADAAAKGDRQISLQDREEFLINVDVNEGRLGGTAVIGGSMYLMLQYRFWNKLQMAERLALATLFLGEVSGRLINVQNRMEIIVRVAGDIAGGVTRAEYGLSLSTITTQMSIISTERRALDHYLLLLDHLNKAIPIQTSIDQIIRQGSISDDVVKQAQAVKDIIDSSKSKLSPDDLGALKRLMNVDDALGIKATLNTVASYNSVIDDAIRNSEVMQKATAGFVAGRIPSASTIKALGMTATSSESYAVVRAGGDMADLVPRLQSVVSASEAVKSSAGGATRLARAGKLSGKFAGKALWIDTIIWGVSLGIDLGLNLFMTEEEQAEIPIIGFLFEGAGWSPIGAIIEGVIDYFVEPEVQQDLFDIFISVLVSASQNETVGGAIMQILDFYIDNVSGELLVPLSFPQNLSIDGTLPNFIPSINPMLILEVAVYAIASKLVFTHWVLPMWDYFSNGLRGNPNAI